MKIAIAAEGDAGRPQAAATRETMRSYANFTYQTGRWSKPRWMIDKVDRDPGELICVLV